MCLLRVRRIRHHGSVQRIKNLIKKLPIIRHLDRDRERIFSEIVQIRQILEKQEKRYQDSVAADQNRLFVPPGHFYSPIPSLEEVRKWESRIFKKIPSQLPGIDLAKEKQLVLLETFQSYCRQIPFPDQKVENLRYFFDNSSYTYSDAVFLYCMMLHLKPNRVVEVGSGFSSCVILDTNELHFDNKISTTFIEPHPELLLSLIKEQDKNRIHLIASALQEVELDEFSTLSENDILFIDSTHVSKVGSDVNYLFFEILPSLNRGVYIHFHDIFYPFEYPKGWILENRAWNELYMLRAFLQYNRCFEIVFFNTFLGQIYKERFEKEIPLFLINPGGSIWLRKISE